MRRVLGVVALLVSLSAGPASLAVAAWRTQEPDRSATISPTSGVPGSRVAVDALCGTGEFEFRLAVQFRAASEPPRDPFADPRLSQQLLESPPGHVVVAVEVPVDAAAGASFFDVTCLNAEGGGIEQLSVSFLVTDLPATGLSVAPLLAGAVAAMITGLTLLRVTARPRR